MQQYHQLLQHILANGIGKGDRTGTGTISTFGYQMRFDLQEGFPLITTKKCHFKSILEELLWFIRGETNAKSLQAKGVKIWDEWATESGELGPIYGKMWRSWPTTTGDTIDQIADVVEQIKRNPNSRRLLVSAWNPEFLPTDKVSPQINVVCGRQALPPCHTLFQFYVQNGKLSCQLYQRSADVFLGVPYNIASYSLLTMMIAQVCGLGLGEFIHTLGDAHLYVNHLEQARLQLSREPYALPKVFLNPDVKNLFTFTSDDIQLVGYEAHPHIAGKVAV